MATNKIKKGDTVKVIAGKDKDKEGKVLAEGTPVQVFSDREVLRETNLEQPAVMELFDSLCRKHILSDALPVPRTLAQLEGYISEIHDFS